MPANIPEQDDILQQTLIIRAIINDMTASPPPADVYPAHFCHILRAACKPDSRQPSHQRLLAQVPRRRTPILPLDAAAQEAAA